MSDQILGDRGRALEDMFFAKESEKLRQAMHEKEDTKNKKQALSAASGITDDAVLETLVALDMRSETLAALSKVGIIIREAQGHLPPVTKGQQPNRARWKFVHRLGLIYAQTVRTQEDIENGLYAKPTRRYDAHKEKEYGPFRDFVVLAHEALGFENSEQGVDDVIRSVWSRMGKKRH